MNALAIDRVVLSMFPGIDLFGRAFEEAGFCVVRGPDLIFGGDVRRFHPPAGVFWGVFGGPPCQDFSGLRRSEVTGEGLEMLGEFRRIVGEARPEWWMAENVARVPDVSIDGYHCQRLDVDLKWFCDATRLRHVQYGSRSGRLLHVTRRSRSHECDSPDVTPLRLPGAALASDSRPLPEVCRLQGLPEDFDIPGFRRDAVKRAVGNGVPLPMGRALVRAIVEAYGGEAPEIQLRLDGTNEVAGRCACGCGRRVTGRKHYYDESCRKRAQRRRDRATSRERVHQ